MNETKEEKRETKISLFFMSLFMGLLISIFITTAMNFMGFEGIAIFFFPAWFIITILGYYIYYPK